MPAELTNVNTCYFAINLDEIFLIRNETTLQCIIYKVTLFLLHIISQISHEAVFNDWLAGSNDSTVFHWKPLVKFKVSSKKFVKMLVVKITLCLHSRLHDLFTKFLFLLTTNIFTNFFELTLNLTSGFQWKTVLSLEPACRRTAVFNGNWNPAWLLYEENTMDFEASEASLAVTNQRHLY